MEAGLQRLTDSNVWQTRRWTIDVKLERARWERWKHPCRGFDDKTFMFQLDLTAPSGDEEAQRHEPQLPRGPTVAHGHIPPFCIHGIPASYHPRSMDGGGSRSSRTCITGW